MRNFPQLRAGTLRTVRRSEYARTGSAAAMFHVVACIALDAIHPRVIATNATGLFQLYNYSASRFWITKLPVSEDYVHVQKLDCFPLVFIRKYFIFVAIFYELYSFAYSVVDVTIDIVYKIYNIVAYVFFFVGFLFQVYLLQ